MKGSDMKKSKDIREMSIYEASDFWDDMTLASLMSEEIKDVKFSLSKKKYVGMTWVIFQDQKQSQKLQ